MQDRPDAIEAVNSPMQEVQCGPTGKAQANAFLAVGNCTLDDVVTPDGQISPRQLGGNAVYAAAGMRLWGVDVSLVSVVGADYPNVWLEQLADAGIDVSAVTRIEEPHLLRSRAFYFADGSRTDRIDEAALDPARLRR